MKTITGAKTIESTNRVTVCLECEAKCVDIAPDKNRNPHIDQYYRHKDFMEKHTREHATVENGFQVSFSCSETRKMQLVIEIK